MTTLAIDFGGLAELIWVAPLAAVLMTTSFSLCVLGATRSSDARRAGRQNAGVAWMAVAFLAGVAVVAELAFGIGIIVGG
jgi:hypothetical protein